MFSRAVGGIGFETDETHAATAYVGGDMPEGRDRLAGPRVTRPRELLLGMQQAPKIHRRVRVAKKLWSGHAERVDGRKRGRHTGLRIRSDSPRKRGGTLGLDAKTHRRIGPPGDSRRPGSRLA